MGTIYFMIIQFAHIMAAVLAVWRITDLVTQDRIMEKFRAKFPIYLWTCPRCFSVWAAMWTTVVFILFPWMNWPFALAWLYLMHLEKTVQKRVVKYGRRFEIRVQRDGNYEVANDFNNQELQDLFNKVFPPARASAKAAD
jgi:hypothetical protein